MMSPTKVSVPVSVVVVPVPLLLFLWTLTSAGNCQQLNTIRNVFSDVTDLTVTPGSDATLRCRFSTRDGGVLALVEWVRVTHGLRERAFFYRDGRSRESYQDIVYRGRVKLRDSKMKDGDASIIVKHANVNDTGEYHFRVAVVKDKAEKRDVTVYKGIVNLTVTDSGGQEGSEEEEETKDGKEKKVLHSGAVAAFALYLGLVGGLVVVYVGLIIVICKNLLRCHNNFKLHRWRTAKGSNVVTFRRTLPSRDGEGGSEEQRGEEDWPDVVIPYPAPLSQMEEEQQQEILL